MSDDAGTSRHPAAPPAAPAEGGPGLAPAGIAPAGSSSAGLDQAFDADSLYALRAAVAAHGTDAGLSLDRAGDLVIAAHELAANVVRHGAGQGRLRLWQHDGMLRCEVTDDGPAGRAAPADGPLWDSGHGHGLWLVRQVADHADGRTGPGGTTVTIGFKLGSAEVS